VSDMEVIGAVLAATLTGFGLGALWVWFTDREPSAGAGAAVLLPLAALLWIALAVTA
jgi:hypothetical protein